MRGEGGDFSGVGGVGLRLAAGKKCDFCPRGKAKAALSAEEGRRLRLGRAKSVVFVRGSSGKPALLARKGHPTRQANGAPEVLWEDKRPCISCIASWALALWIL